MQNRFNFLVLLVELSAILSNKPGMIQKKYFPQVIKELS